MHTRRKTGHVIHWVLRGCVISILSFPRIWIETMRGGGGGTSTVMSNLIFFIEKTPCLDLVSDPQHHFCHEKLQRQDDPSPCWL